MRGPLRSFGLADKPPHPALRADLSPQAGRGEIDSTQSHHALGGNFDDRAQPGYRPRDRVTAPSSDHITRRFVLFRPEATCPRSQTLTILISWVITCAPSDYSHWSPSVGSPSRFPDRSPQRSDRWSSLSPMHESDRSDEGLSDRLPFDGCVLVDVGVDVCASAGTIPATVPNNRAISNFMTHSKLSGRYLQMRSIHYCVGKLVEGEPTF